MVLDKDKIYICSVFDLKIDYVSGSIQNIETKTSGYIL